MADATVDQWRQGAQFASYRKAKLLLDREGSSGPVRLLLRVALDPEGCSHGPFLYVKDVGAAVQELRARGLTPSVWKKYTAELTEMRRKHLPVGCHPMRWGFSVGTLLTLGTLGCCVAAPGKRRFLADLADWQARFNTEALNGLGMTVKTQCYVWGDSVGGRRFEKMLSWLTFALTPEEGMLLAQEPHLLGDVRSGSCAPGPLDERGQPIQLAAADTGGILPSREHVVTSASMLRA